MYFDSNENLIDYLSEYSFFDENLKRAFLAVDRKKFVPKDAKEFVYQDSALPLFEGQTISQPTTVAFMLSLLDVRKGEKILDIGAGSGWTSALLANLSGKEGLVFAFEINKEVGTFGKDNLEKAGFENVRYFIESAEKRWRDFAPYDKIHSGAGFEKIPKDLKKFLKIGGILVAPTQAGDVRKIVRKSEDDFEEKIFPGFVFVPFIEMQR